MSRYIQTLAVVTLILLGMTITATAADKEIVGVTFPGEKAIEGKTLKLNGVACRKALLVVKVYAGGFYLEHPTQNAQEAIESEQVKHFHLHYLTKKATAKKLQEGFIEAMEKANPPELVQKYRADIERYASWLDQDMAPGATSLTTYVPGKGLTLTFKGVPKGTIAGKEFAQMYFRYNLGPGADSGLKKGYLGQ